MYSTRQQQMVAANDENTKQLEQKAATRKAAAIHAAKMVAAVQTNSRRALGDIGNLVGPMSTLCNPKDSKNENNAAAKPAAQPVIERPITRRFVAQLASNLNAAKPPVPPQQEAAGQGGEVVVKVESKTEESTSWGVKQRRTTATIKIQQDGTQNAAPAPDSRHGNPVLPPGHPARMKALLQKAGTRAARRKEKTLTATLTARSEAACGGLVEIEGPLPNIDEADMANQLAVVDYVEDIYSFYRKIEVLSCVSPNYMSNQTDINEKMRAILVDWLIEVHLKFKLMPETLFLTTNLIDRYLSLQSVPRKFLQLVGVTAMLLSSKYEEIWAPEVQDFVFITDSAYTRDEILAMEKKMLNTLKFNLTVPTPYVFMVRFLKAAGSDRQMEMLAFFLVELCLTEYSMVKFPPSLLAASAVYAAQSTLKKDPLWTPLLRRHSGYTEEQLRECSSMMVGLHRRAGDPEKNNKLMVVHKKYSSSKFESAAALSPAKLPHEEC